MHRLQRLRVFIIHRYTHINVATKQNIHSSSVQWCECYAMISIVGANELLDKWKRKMEAVVCPMRTMISHVITMTSLWARLRLTIFYSTVYSRHRSKKTSKLRVTGLCAGNSPVTGEFPAQMASYAENLSIWWRHHGQAHYCGAMHP